MSRLLSVLAILCVLAVALGGCGADDPVAPSNDPSVTAPTVDKARGMNPNPRIIPPHARPHGKSYAEWSAAWWQWLWSAPAATNPGLDTTGEFVSWGQSGKVWFLAPNYGFDQVDHRTATIPRGTMLFIDVVGFFGSTATGDGDTVEEIMAALGPLTEAVTDIVLEVDGVAYDITSDYLVYSIPFAFTLPEDNMFQYFGMSVEAGTYEPGVAYSYHVMLAPLSRGEHTIHIYADLGAVGWGTSEVFFDLTVE